MRGQKRLLSLCALVWVGCNKQPAPAAKAPEPAPAKAAEAPVEVAPVATPTEAPAAASPTEAPAASALHVSVDMRTGAKMTPGLPTVGEAASFRVTLRGPDGQFLSNLDPLLGGKMLAVVARADLGWSTVLRTDELSDKARGTHDFRMVFPFSGIHRMWFLYSYEGKIRSEELSFSIMGKPWVGKELPESEVSWKDDKGLAARLIAEPAVPTTCQPFLVATAWTRNGKPVRMTGAPDASTTWYVAIEGSLGEIVTSSAEPQPTPLAGAGTESTAVKMGGDLGTVAVLNVTRPGRYRVLAVATPPGASAGQRGASVVASFVVSVQGALHEGGCNK